MLGLLVAFPFYPTRPSTGSKYPKSGSLVDFSQASVAVLSSHDLRCGSARDTANLRAEIPGVGTEVVYAILSQSKESYNKGITAAYFRSTSSDIWATRIEDNHEDPFGLPVVHIPFGQRKRPRLLGACTRRFAENVRAKAGYINRKRLAKDFVSQKVKMQLLFYLRPMAFSSQHQQHRLHLFRS